MRSKLSARCSWLQYVTLFSHARTDGLITTYSSMNIQSSIPRAGNRILQRLSPTETTSIRYVVACNRLSFLLIMLVRRDLRTRRSTCDTRNDKRRYRVCDCSNLIGLWVAVCTLCFNSFTYFPLVPKALLNLRSIMLIITSGLVGTH